MKAKVAAVFKTSDDEVFETQAEAEAHQEQVDKLEIVTTDIKDLLNQVLLKLKDVPDYSDPYLDAIKDTVTDLVNRESDYSDEDYYSSNC